MLEIDFDPIIISHNGEELRMKKNRMERNRKNAAAAVVLSGVMVTAGTAGSAAPVFADTTPAADNSSAAGGRSVSMKAAAAAVKPANKAEAKEAYSKAQEEVKRRQTARDQAVQKTAAAQKALDAVKDTTRTISYGTDPAPYYQKAKDILARIKADAEAARKDAKEKQKQAEEKQQKAEKKLDEKAAASADAEKNLSDSEGVLKKVKEQKSEADKAVQDAQEKLNQVKSDGQKSEEDVKAAEENLKKAVNKQYLKAEVLETAKEAVAGWQETSDNAELELNWAEDAVRLLKSDVFYREKAFQKAAASADAANKISLNNPESYKNYPELSQAMKEYQNARNSCGSYSVTVPADRTAQRKALEEAKAAQKKAEQDLSRAIADLTIAKANLREIESKESQTSRPVKIIVGRGKITSIKAVKYRKGKKYVKDKRKVTVRWKKVRNAEYYRLYVRTSKNGKYKQAVKTKKLSSSFTAKKGRTIYVKVRAQNGKTNGRMSVVKKLKVR